MFRSSRGSHSVARRTGTRVAISTAVIASFFTLSLSAPAHATTGALDPSFGTNGLVTHDFGNDDGGYSIATQTDSKPIVAVTSLDSDFVGTSYAARLTTSGVLDTTYGASSSGIRQLAPSDDTAVSEVAIDHSGGATDGYSVFVGAKDTNADPIDETLAGFIEVLDTSGAPVAGFGSSGIATQSGVETFDHVIVQPDGKILAIGSVNDQPVVYRYNTDGTVDTSYGTVGRTVLGTWSDAHVWSVGMDSSSNLWMAGTNSDGPVVFKLTSSGGAGFAGGVKGKAVPGLNPDPSFPTTLTINGTNVIVSGVNTDSYASLVELDSTGTLVPGFGSAGVVNTQFLGAITGMLTQSDGRIIASVLRFDTNSADITLARFSLYGATDNSFGTNGVVTTDIGSNTFDLVNSMTEDANHKILVTGYTAPTSGDIDNTFVMRFDGSISSALDAGASAPLNATATNNDNGQSVTLTWNAPTYNGGSSILSYDILQVTNGSPVPAPIDVSAPTTTATISGLTLGQSYTFQITATNTAGHNSFTSLTNTATVTGPSTAPQHVSAIAQNNGQIKVQWDAPANLGGHTITNYVVQYADGTSAGSTGNGTTTSKVVSGLQAGQLYSFKVAAVNSAGSSPFAASNQSYTTGSNTGAGYYLSAADGGVFSYGNAPFYGSMGGKPLNQPIVDAALTSSGQGYWQVAADGGIFAFGDAHFSGSMGGLPLNKPIVGMAATPTGGGYWEVASDGGVFSFGDAAFKGSMGDRPLNKPIVDLVPTPTGLGYWEVASDGGIFAFGDASFQGSMGGQQLNKPIVGLATTPSGAGYWEVASDGGIFAFGDAAFYGSTGNIQLNAPIQGILASPSGHGYMMVASDGGTFNYGDFNFQGSAGGSGLAAPVVTAIRN